MKEAENKKPSNLNEQANTSNYIPKNDVDPNKLAQEFEKVKTKLDALKKSILKKYNFTVFLGLLPGNAAQLFEEEETIPKEEARKFFNDYHIQGANNLGVVFFGLIFDNEVLGVMSLGRHSRQYKDLIVLDRLCFKDGVQVVGGASKLFKSCTGWAKKEEYNSIISFSDNR
jgi:hypothetical protein